MVGLKDLNLRPTDYESDALTAELRARALILDYGRAGEPVLATMNW